MRLEEALDQGAFGLSTGLEYEPGRYTPTAEIVELARLVARRGGLYASHIRNEDARLLEAVAEAIEVGRQSGARVEIAHLKAAGDSNWPKQGSALDLLGSARADGVAVLADAYPYTAYSTTLTTFMEGWAREGGTEAILARFRDPEARARIRREVEAQVRVDPGSWERVVVSRDPKQLLAQWAGERIHNVADIPIFAFDRGQIEEIAARLERRSKLSLSIPEREMYVELDGWTCQMDITEHRVP